MFTNANLTSDASHRLTSQLDQDAMVLYDAYRPGLQAGRYRVVVSQDIAVADREQHTYFQGQELVVRGRRFNIEKDDVHAFYPAPGARGPYGRVLPHIVFKKRALPWERNIGEHAGDAQPWLALVLLNQTELASLGPSIQKTLPLTALNPMATQPTSTVMGPNLLGEGHAPDTPVSVIDLPRELFAATLPKLEDLSYLAHVRSVSPLEKVPLNMHALGDFSVLVSNRFPNAGTNTALVISLEGWGKWLADPGAIPKQVTHLRFVTPLSWQFNCDDSGEHTFAQQLAGLDLGNFCLQLESQDAAIKARLQRGLVPVSYQPPQGEASFAWYRGPFSPTPVAPNANGWKPIKRSEDAMLWDAQSGTLEITYAAAWQLGRLLALASASFTNGLRTFLGDYHHAAEAAERLAAFLKNHGTDPEASPADQELAKDMLDWLANLALLYPMPNHYLVADPALLPPDTLRFFHLDPNWIAALVAGALSAGLQCRRDFEATHQQDLLKPLSKLVQQYRMQLMGKEAVNLAEGDFFKTPITGFLLRSQLIADWPGLEVEVTTAGSKKADGSPLLRLDHLGDHLMLGLVRGTIESVHFKEPREQLSFGLDTEGNLSLRSPDKPGSSNQRVDAVQKTFARADAADGVMDMHALAGSIVSALPDTSAKRGSALLALQLLRAPKVHTIHWSAK